MSNPFPKLCRDCKHSAPSKDSAWSLRCHHPIVNANDAWALASVEDHAGTGCREEREKRFFAGKCGMAGDLWEAK